MTPTTRIVSSVAAARPLALAVCLGWLAAAGCAAEPSDPPAFATTQKAYGEVVDGFPSWYERLILALVNRARCDPVTALAGCTSCADAPCFTTALPPMEWSLPLSRAARFHADNLTQTGCGMQHDSACDIVSNIDALYPDTCDGSPSCACVGGTADCNGGGFSSRCSLFGAGAWAENIAWYGNPLSVFDAWLLESCSDPTCAWGCSGGTGQNGHRWNILGSYSRLGVGGSGGYTVQDFGGGALTQRIPSGAHHPQTGAQITFYAHWYDTSGPLAALVNIEGTCHAMTLERGTSTNGTYRYEGPVASGCQRYFFLFKDALDQSVYYPETGSFGIDCGFEFDTARPPEGAGCSCDPDCAGKACGDDGCGGSCGDCAADETCQAGQCVCAELECGGSCCAAGEVCSGGACCQPDCGAAVCGDDGCGGSCGACPAPQSCVGGTCVGAGSDAVAPLPDAETSAPDAGSSSDASPTGGDPGVVGGGCACATGAAPAAPAALLLGWLLLLSVRRRRRR